MQISTRTVIKLLKLTRTQKVKKNIIILITYVLVYLTSTYLIVNFY